MWPSSVYPYFEASKEKYELMCVGMAPGGKYQLANMLAHHLMPLRRDSNGWILTRMDLALEGKFWHVSNEGKLTYDYKPDGELFLDKQPA